MISCAIIDDEISNVEILRNLIRGFCPELRIVGETTRPDEAIALINNKKPQLIFLDIQMPQQNAFDLLNRLMPVDFEVIFVTAFDNYAIRAIKYSILDYLLKPVDIDELKSAVVKACEKINGKTINQRLENLLFNAKSKNHNQKIALPTLGGLSFFDIADIVNCTAEGPYTIFSFLQGQNITVTGNLKEFEEMLPEENFCRVHHSHLININHIKKYYKGKGGYVEMVNGKSIEVSQRKRNDFLERFIYKEKKDPD